MNRFIEGVKLSDNKIINSADGSVLHGIKRTDNYFYGFGEAYFSTVNFNCVKGWKKHIKMNLNLVVPHGEILFVLYDDRSNSITKNQFMDFTISLNNYYRLTVPPNVWMAFKGEDTSLNLLLNVANIEHDSNEVVRTDLNKIKYQW